MQRYNVGIVGATGIVGQRLIQRLAGHPWFDVAALAASERSAGKRYGDAAAWRLSGDPPKGVADLPVKPSRAEQFVGCDLVLSALDAATARAARATRRPFSTASVRGWRLSCSA